MSFQATATASSHPCQLYAHTSAPIPVRTQYHHRLPQEFQNKIWGEVRYDTGNWMMWTCGLCHDAIHEWIDFLLKGYRKPDPAIEGKYYREAILIRDYYNTAVLKPLVDLMPPPLP